MRTSLHDKQCSANKPRLRAEIEQQIPTIAKLVQRHTDMSGTYD